MDRTLLALSSIAWTLVLVGAVVLPAFAGMATAAVANEDARPDAYAIEQGDRCISLSPIGNASQDVDNYYDYRSGTGDEFSSHGTTRVQEVNVSQLYVYRGSNGDSLVALHDALGDDGGGGAVSMTFAGVPDNGTWAVLDDDYETPDDQYATNGSEHVMDWMWAPGRTDGGALLGIAEQGYDGIEIDAHFGENSWAAQERNTTWPYAHHNVSWVVRNGEGTLVPLEKDEPITFRRGGCPSAVADVPATARVGQPLTLDGTNSTRSGMIAQYRWTVNGTELDGATVQHTFTRAGTVDVGLTVVTETGYTDSANATVEVVPDGPPNASLETPATATTGDAITLDASGSTDDHEIAEYRWDLDGNGSIDNTTTSPQYETSYESAGEHSPTVTVVDDAGHTDRASATVDVSLPAFETTLSANRTSVETGEPVEFSANATPADLLEGYEYDFGDGGTATGAESVHAYEQPGEYTVTVTATSTDGRTRTASTVVTVNASEPSGGGDGDGGDDGSSDDEGSGDDGESGNDGGNSGGTDGGGGAGAGGGGGGGGGGAGGGGGGGAVAPQASPSIEVVNASLNRTSIAVGQSVRVTTTLENSGDGEGTERLGLSVDGSVVHTREVDVAADATRTVGINYTGTEPGEFVLSVNGTSAGNLTVRPGLELVDLVVPSEPAVVDEPVTVEAIVANTGNRSTSEEVVLNVDGNVSTARTVLVRAGVNRTVTFSPTFESPGGYAVAVAGTNRTVVVENGTGAGESGGDGGGAEEPASASAVDVVDLALPTQSVEVGEGTTIEATLSNDGEEAATIEVALTVDDDVSTVRTVEVPSGESRTVTFERAFELPGEYEVGVLGTNGTVAVTAASQNGTAGSDPGNENGEDGGMGDLLLLGSVGILVLVGTILGLSRWMEP